MLANETLLWKKIESFVIDDASVAFKFSDRLARENGWELVYAKRVIEEYKKFIFLCCVAEKGVTTSDPVDQAWHLHLTFTKSYWIDLCQDTLNKQIHHNPTKGGKTEADKFDGFYTSSQQLYIRYFKMEPPADIWQPNKTRFTDINFQRVNLGKYWIIKKPQPTVYGVGILMLFIISATFIQASDTAFSVLLMLGVCIAVVAAIYKWESKPNPDRWKNKDSDGCSTAGGGNDLDSSHHSGHHDSHGGDSGHSGCGSGCSGCSSSGCSGCGSH